MDEAAVLDAPVEETEETTPIEAPAPETVGAVEGQEQVAPLPAAVDAPAIENGRIAPHAKEYLDKLKAENPALEKQIRNALYSSEQWKKEFPGGLKELQAMRSLVEERGGADGLRDMAERLGSFEEFDKTYFAGDPRALEHMTSTPEGQQALVRLMPAALDKFQQISPDGYTAHMAGLFAATMDAWRMPVALELLSYLVGDNPRAVEQLQKIQGFYGQMQELSQKKPAEKSQQQPAAQDPDRAKFEQERQQFTREQWKAETAREQQSTFTSEWERLAGGRKLSDGQDAAVRELFESKLTKAVQARHADKLERYFKANDKQGFMRYAAEINRTEVPAALKAAFDQVMPAKPGPKAAPAPNGKPVQPPANGKAAQGFTQVSQAPSSDEVDYKHSFNNKESWQAGKAVLKSGQMVQWKR